jgi:hypothetical protein
MFVYCFLLRRYPAAHVFMVCHSAPVVDSTDCRRLTIAMTLLSMLLASSCPLLEPRSFGGWVCGIDPAATPALTQPDPFGAIAIGLLILFSWASTAFDHVWLLVGKGAPREFLSKVIYVAITHDENIRKVDTVSQDQCESTRVKTCDADGSWQCRAYHAGEKYYVEVDIIMDEELPLRVTHDVSQSLQRKLEGLEDVERAFVHVDYEAEHDIREEHKPLHEKPVPHRSLKEVMRDAKKKVDNRLH